MSRNLENELVSFDVDSYIVDADDCGHIETNRAECESGMYVYAEEYDRLLGRYKMTEVVFWMVRELVQLKHFSSWAVGACYDLAIRSGLSAPGFTKEQVVAEVKRVLKETGIFL